jgi:hypothetical protein
MKPVASQHPHGMSATKHSTVSQRIVPVALTVVKSEENLMGRIQASPDTCRAFLNVQDGCDVSSMK